MLSETINIAICFNDKLEAQSFSQKIEHFGPDINFIIGENFDGFLKAIAAKTHIDCFIIDENYKECSSFDLIEKLKKSQRYKKSVISLLTPNLKKIDKKFLELGIHYIFDSATDINQINLNLKNAIVKKLTPVIPKDYNVMVLDNNPEILELISMHLHELGHKNFDLCSGVKEAKISLVDKSYDLLLLDWNLDDGTCIDLIEFIKSSTIAPRTKDALIVVITGRDDVDDIMILLRYGVKDYIIKPFDFAEFEEKIGYGLEKHLKK